MGNICETGKVLSIEGDLAKVEIFRTDNCFSCAQKSVCSVFKDDVRQIIALNVVGANPGDIVELSMDSATFLGASFLVFVLPLFLMALFYIIANLILSVGISLLFAFVGFAIGMVLAFFVFKGKNTRKLRYRITGIKSEASNQQ